MLRPKETIENEVEREEEYQRRFWAPQPDGIVVDKKKEIWYVLEFKRKMDRWMGYRQEATDRATNQYASLMHGRQGASKWTERSRPWGSLLTRQSRLSHVTFGSPWSHLEIRV